MKHLQTAATLVAVFQFFNLCECNATSPELPWWDLPEEEALCTFAINNPNFQFCDDVSEADDNCKKIVGALNGTDPVCSDGSVCQFHKNNQAQYATCDTFQNGYDVLRNCPSDIGACSPNEEADLTDGDYVTLWKGKEGQGKYETTTLKQRKVCFPSNTTSMNNCKEIEFRSEVTQYFHPSIRLGQLQGGQCLNASNDTAHPRCVFQGVFFSNESQKRERCRFHFFNQGDSEEVVVMGYWGDKNVIIGTALNP